MFLLYQKKYKAFPETVLINGRIYKINADFRNILRILGILHDFNIPDVKKADRIINWFFEDGFPENISPDLIIDTIGGFIYINGAEESKDGMHDIFSGEKQEKQFCYNFDAKEIYADFISEYAIDLTGADFLHWYKFKILLDNLSSESAFKKKIELRFIEPYNEKLAEAKEAVQLPNKFQTEDTEQISREINEFNEKWGKAGK